MNGLGRLRHPGVAAALAAALLFGASTPARDAHHQHEHDAHWDGREPHTRRQQHQALGIHIRWIAPILRGRPKSL